MYFTQVRNAVVRVEAKRLRLRVHCFDSVSLLVCHTKRMTCITLRAYYFNPVGISNKLKQILVSLKNCLTIAGANNL